MKVLVLGGCGAMGKAMVRELYENPEVEVKDFFKGSKKQASPQ